MAYSPSPQSPSLLMSTTLLHHPRTSTTPPLSLSITKRDKRRNATMERLNDISQSFNANREAHSKMQLSALTRDIQYIHRADIYHKPLDDLTDEIDPTGNSTTDGAHPGLRGEVSNGSFTNEPRAGWGKWRARFVQEINNAMEERDVQLTEVAIRYDEKKAALEEEQRFAIRIAEEEHKALGRTIRDRVIQQVHKKKNQMLKEKEHLDIADTNALLLHPSQFSITHPASPGGAHSNRKTRHTRHRLDVDDLNKAGDSSKRKRKVPAEFENGSPGPISRPFEPDNIYWEKSQAGIEYQQNSAPLLSIERLFTTKELTMATDTAVKTAAHIWTAKLAKARHNEGQTVDGSVLLTNGDLSDNEGNLAVSGNGGTANEMDGDDENGSVLDAPEMDRTGSQSMHATRSSRNLIHNNPPHSSMSIPERKAAARTAALAAIASQLKLARNKDSESLAFGLTEQEAIDDLLMMGVPLPEKDKDKDKRS